MSATECEDSEGEVRYELGKEGDVARPRGKGCIAQAAIGPGGTGRTWGVSGAERAKRFFNVFSRQHRGRGAS